jgi:predicted ArsR family transcriptional regulator
LRERASAHADRPLRLAEQAVQELGYHPDRRRDQLMLRNCPFTELAASHRELICPMNHALLSGLLPALGATGLSVAGPRPKRQPGPCCVTITQAHDG